jgi:hypothetical protein
MKARLIKTETAYALYVGDKRVAQVTFQGYSGVLYGAIGRLSKRNCDELFGVPNADSFAEEFKGKINGDAIRIYKAGFAQALEMSKDKLFTIPEVIKLCTDYYKIGVTEAGMPQEKKAVLPKEIIEDLKLLRPTEIEVEIVMEDFCQLLKTTSTSICSRCQVVSDECKRPKLDSEGFLMIARI